MVSDATTSQLAATIGSYMTTDAFKKTVKGDIYERLVLVEEHAKSLESRWNESLMNGETGR